MKAPIFDGINKHTKNRGIPFISPGHKARITMRAKSVSLIDLYGYDNDSLDMKELIAESEDIITRKYSTCRTMYLRNGATGGIYAMLGTYTVPGDKVIVDRECHRSVVNALILLGLTPVFVKRNYNYQLSMVGGVDTQALENTIITNSDAKAVIVTSPNYYGVVSDIKTIARICHSHGIKLLVDEALGAHFGFSRSMPSPAARQNADVSVQSVSKTLGSLKGGALIHIADPDIDFQRMCDLIRMYETSSASPALLCTLENAVYYAFENGDVFERIFKEIEKSRKLISENTSIQWLGRELSGNDYIFDMDPFRIVLNLSRAKIDGYTLAETLRKKEDIEVEAATENSVVCIASIYNTVHEIRKLTQALMNLSKKIGEKTVLINDVMENAVPEDLDMRMTPEKAFNASGEFLASEYCHERISKRTIYRMPDQVPIVFPGERIKNYHILEISKVLSSGGTVKGLGPDNSVEVVSLAESFNL